MPQTITTLVEQIIDTVLSVRPIAVSAAHTITIGTVFHCDASGGAFTITLPTAGTLANDEVRIIILIKTDSSANAVTVSRAGSDTINAATTHSLSAQYKYLILVDSEAGGVWFNIGSN